MVVDEEESTWIVNVIGIFLESEQHQYFKIFNLLLAAVNLVLDIERDGTNPMVFSRFFMFSCWLSFMLAASSDHLVMCFAFENYHFFDIFEMKTDLVQATVIWLDYDLCGPRFSLRFVSGTSCSSFPPTWSKVSAELISCICC